MTSCENTTHDGACASRVSPDLSKAIFDLKSMRAESQMLFEKVQIAQCSSSMPPVPCVTRKDLGADFIEMRGGERLHSEEMIDAIVDRKIAACEAQLRQFGINAGLSSKITRLLSIKAVAKALLAERQAVYARWKKRAGITAAMQSIEKLCEAQIEIEQQVSSWPVTCVDDVREIAALVVDMSDEDEMHSLGEEFIRHLARGAA